MTANTQFLDLPCGIKAFTIENEDGTYTIILNSHLCYEALEESYKHELEHIKNNDFEGFDADVIEYILHEVEYG